MVRLCNVCAARKAVIEDKLRARGGGVVLSDIETQQFEAYLYSQTPLCCNCKKIHITPRDVITPSCDVITSPRDGTMKSTAEKQNRNTNVRILGLVAVAMATLSLIISLMIINNSDEVRTVLRSLASLHLDDVISRPRDLLTRYKYYDNEDINSILTRIGVDEVVYLVVFVIQITTVLVRQPHRRSMFLSLISFLIFKYGHLLSVSREKLYLDVTRYCLLGVALLLLFTKKSIVVTTLKRKPTQKPVIKVRRSPRKKSETLSSPLGAGLFSEDECDPLHKPPDPGSTVFETSSISTSLLEISRDSPRDPMLRDQGDVSSRFNIMKISSPLKKNFNSPSRPNSKHVSCLKPARFSLDRNETSPRSRDASLWSRDASPRSRDPSLWSRDASPRSRDPSLWSRDTAVSDDHRKEGRPRFDSTGSSDTDHLNTAEGPKTNESSEHANLPLKPILIVLIVSVVMNYYLIVNYVLKAAPGLNPEIIY